MTYYIFYVFLELGGELKREENKKQKIYIYISKGKKDKTLPNHVRKIY